VSLSLVLSDSTRRKKRKKREEKKKKEGNKRENRVSFLSVSLPF
jgi:hypothetical protein